MATSDFDARIAELEAQLKDPPKQPTEIYSRIVGYYRSLNNWNVGKREEYRQRATYNVPQSIKSVVDPIKRTNKEPKRTTFRPDQKGALPIVGEFTPLQLGKADDDWSLGEREEGVGQHETCESCQ